MTTRQSSLLNITSDEKSLILWAELGGLLHDIGKLSNVFLDYRRKWQDREEIADTDAKAFFGKDQTGTTKIVWHYENDPHDPGKEVGGKFLDYDPLIHCSKNFSQLWKQISVNRVGLIGYLTFTLKDLVDEHTNRKAANPIQQILCTSDSKDAAENRNNPLFCTEQTGTLVRSSPFGHESELKEDQDQIRKKLYVELEKLLPNYWTTLENLKEGHSIQEIADLRQQILDQVEEAFGQGISDTCKPAHDISLWDHAYGTACLFKAYLAGLAAGFNLFSIDFAEKEAMEKAIQEFGATDFDKGHFALLGFGWDGLSYIEKGEKIGDSVGRIKQLESLKQKLRYLVEVKYCLGNRIYEDENGIYFLIPQLSVEEGAIGEDDILSPLKKEAQTIANEVTYGELPFYGGVVPTTEYLNTIVILMDILQEQWATPWSGLAGGSPFQHWEGISDREVCPICRLRPTVNEEKKICACCLKIREAAKPGADEQKQATIFTGEIVGSRQENPSGKAALLVACFGLREWLNGKMLYSIMVKEGRTLKQEIDHRPTITGFSDEMQDLEKTRKKTVDDEWKKTGRNGFNYDGIVQDIACLGKAVKDETYTGKTNTYSGAVADFYFRYINKGKLLNLERFMYKDLKDIYRTPPKLPNFLITQNHTPSRLLAIWEETKRFFGEIKENLPNDLGLPLKQRAQLELSNSESLQEFKGKIQGVYTLSLSNGRQVEVLPQRDGSLVTVDLPFDQELKDILKDLYITEIQGEYEKKKLREPVRDCKITRVSESYLAYYPYRPLLVSPLVFMIMVPANYAMETAQIMKERYDQRFGKVKGRLPLSVGLTFFKEHTPMFAVLDAGKRMIRNFEKLHRRHRAFRVCCQQGECSTFQLRRCSPETAVFPTKFRTTIEEDNHYPFIIAKQGEGFDTRQSYQRTLVGDVVHFSDIREGDEISAYPNYLDWIFLDATTRRFDLHMEQKGETVEKQKVWRRPGALPYLPATLPYYLDELEGVTGLWDRLKESKVSDTALRNLETLLLQKLALWHEGPGSDLLKDATWRRLVEAAVRTGFDPKEWEPMQSAIGSGIFFDTLELYLRILKLRLKEDQDDLNR